MAEYGSEPDLYRTETSGLEGRAPRHCGICYLKRAPDTERQQDGAKGGEIKQTLAKLFSKKEQIATLKVIKASRRRLQSLEAKQTENYYNDQRKSYVIYKPVLNKSVTEEGNTYTCDAILYTGMHI